MVLLEVQGLTKRFGGLTAVNDVNFTVIERDMMGVIGPNGAGKTTLYNMVSGFLKPTKGRVFYKGENVTNLKPHELTFKGLVRTFQNNNLFQEMTVFKNVLVAHQHHSKDMLRRPLFASFAVWKKDRQNIEQKIMKILGYMGLTPFKNELAKNLPHGLQRALGIAIASATDPELLLLDEPLTGMNPQEVITMTGLINGLREKGITIMVVEHNMKAIMKLCNRIVVLNFGKKIAEGSPMEIQNNKEVIEAYLGAEELR